MDPRRVVELYNPYNKQTGTGYLIRDNLILTAQHIITPVGEQGIINTPYDIRLLGERMEERADWRIEGCFLCWEHPDPQIDLALLKLTGDKPSFLSFNSPAITFGKLSYEEAFAEGIGFPVCQNILGAPNPERVKGWLSLTAALTEKQLRLEVTSLIPKSFKEWGGISGTALFVEDILVGVIVETNKSFAERALWVTPISRIANNEEFCRLVSGNIDASLNLIDIEKKLKDKSDPLPVDWNWYWGQQLLEKKQLPEIRKRLKDKLGLHRSLMDVSIEEEPSSVNRNPLRPNQILEIHGKNPEMLSADELLIKIFKQDDIAGKLLILGAPGTGKTIQLLILAEQLVDDALKNPKTVIPILFELSTWRNDKQSIQDWLIEQLYDMHGGNRKEKIYEKWLERQVLLPLMDGLDELGLEQQKKCIIELNKFGRQYPQMVVCCRKKEFEAANIRLKNMNGAISLKPLSDDQIYNYLKGLNCLNLWSKIPTNLQNLLDETPEGDPGLLRIPLFLHLTSAVYNPQDNIDSKADLLEKYIEYQLSFDKRSRDREKNKENRQWAYKTVETETNFEKTINTLTWLAKKLEANNNVEFLIEQMQPSWIKSTNWQGGYRLIFGLIFGLSLWLINELANGLTSELLLGLNYMLIGGLSAWLSYGLSYGLSAWLSAWLSAEIIDRLSYGLSYGLSACLNYTLIFGLSYALKNGLNYWLINELIAGIFVGLLFGVIGGVIGGLIKIEPIEGFKISTSRATRQKISKKLKIGIINGIIGGLLCGLLAALLFGLLEILWFGDDDELIFQLLFILWYGLINGLWLGLLYGLLYGLINGLKLELKIQLRPNQGIWNSLQNMLLTIFSSLILFIPITYFLYHDFSQNWSDLPSILLFFGEIVIIYSFAISGGKACLQHLSLRLILWLSSPMPWNVARFLNYCVERRLLLRIGGRYRFLHKELRDHFTLKNTSS